MKRRVVTVASLALSSALVACGSKGSVALSVGIDTPTAAVSVASPLGASLTGGFTLYLELGAYAPSGTDVSPRQGNFSLVNPSDQASLVLLRLTSAVPPPFHLEPAGKGRIAFTIDEQGTNPGQFVTVQERDEICRARTVQIAGSVTDSASGNPTPITSSSFDMTGCE